MKESVLDVQVVVEEEELSSMEEEEGGDGKHRDMDLEVVNMVIMDIMVLSSYTFEYYFLTLITIFTFSKIK